MEWEGVRGARLLQFRTKGKPEDPRAWFVGVPFGVSDKLNIHLQSDALIVPHTHLIGVDITHCIITVYSTLRWRGLLAISDYIIDQRLGRLLPAVV